MDQYIIYAYVLSAVLFVFALKMMASPKTARRGNLIGAMGMLIAILATLMSKDEVGLAPLIEGSGWWWVIIGGVAGSLLGGVLAVIVKMTAMPQMVAMFNGFGGLASGLVVFAVVLDGSRGSSGELAVTAGISTLIGWVTFTGSIIAFAKLQEFVISGKPLTFPMQKIANMVVLLACVGAIVVWGYCPDSWWIIIPLALASAVFGVMFVIPIGGADMPVVISLLNSYSGLAACATGFVLGNPGLIIAGSLVGASGIVLTRLMCQAMNRSLANVLFAAVGSTIADIDKERQKSVKRYTGEDGAMVLMNAQNVVFVPGYGLAVAQAQHNLKELADLLEARGTTVKFGIHPVAGRMPGHMNVLLAEADVPYEQLCDLETINPEFESTDVVLTIGANDVINPAARTDPESPIAGMPILDVDKAQTVMIIKRSLSPGFAGIDNDLFYDDKTMMLFGDGKQMLTDLVAAMKEM
jgi:H+-translocating NAD(P) transhydrogenase subunit beta